MKTIPRKHLMLMLLPLFSPLANAEPSPEPVPVTPSKATEGASASWRASEIIGTSVKAANDDKIGEVEDLIVDFKTGEILGVVVSAGGFLGIDDTLSSVPASALRYDTDAKAFKTKLTKEQLTKAPQYKKDTWESTKESMSETLRAYQKSIASGVDTSAPDNAARNDKDKGLTPVDQGTSDADVKTTKDIRAELVASELSFNAKNVKVITRDGKVTLRGVVDTTAEKDAVADTAKKHADPSMVSNQLQVKN